MTTYDAGKSCRGEDGRPWYYVLVSTDSLDDFHMISSIAKICVDRDTCRDQYRTIKDSIEDDGK